MKALAGLRDREQSIVEQLQGALRPQFAEGVIFFDAADPVLGGPACGAVDCGRTAVMVGMCTAHHQRWVAAGRPAPAVWAATVPASSRSHTAARPCDATGCRRGRSHGGLCATHFLRWERAGRPQRGTWAAERSGPLLARGPACGLSTLGCTLEGEGSAGLCRSHEARWARQGKPPIGDYLTSCAAFGRDRFDLRSLPMPMRVEVAYAIQRRVDERRTKTRPDLIRRLLTQLPASGALSLLDRSASTWTTDLGFSTERGSVAHRFLLDAIGYLDDLVDGVGWDAEYPRDVWLLRRLGYPGRDNVLRFDRIEAGWLRSLTKRWARWRLSTGIGLGTVLADVRAISVFSEFCPALRRGPEALTREQIERHLAHLVELYPSAKTRKGHIGTLAGLLRASRQHSWEPRLASSVDIYREDYPRLDMPAPRALSEVVMTQLERPANLDRFSDPRGRLLAKILMATGLRGGDAARLAIDCVVHDGQGAPYLHYTNHKMRRDAFVPIDTDLAESIAVEQRAVVAEFPDGGQLLPRRTRNPNGRLPFSTSTFRGELLDWLITCDVRDELGRAVHVTPHQWRHTYGTRLINNEVPQETVRRLLDHVSHEMTAHYARLSDKTIRDQWDRARKVNVRGEELAADAGPLADAVWMKNNLARAKMALPNGYCTLPIQQSCEYANACLTCAVFVTTVEFLPQHRRQLDATRALVAQAERGGQQRVVEMNKSVEKNLLSIIDTLDAADPADEQRRSDDDEPRPPADLLEDADAS